MILLDTHTFVWFVSDRSKLSQRALAVLLDTDHRLAVSVVSAWEITLLYKKGRIRLPMPPVIFIERAMARHGIEELPLLRGVVIDAVGLPELHNDPFDRILVAEAMRRDCPIITKDQTIPSYPGVSTIW